MVNNTRSRATIVSGKNWKRMYNFQSCYCLVFDASDYPSPIMDSKRMMLPLIPWSNTANTTRLSLRQKISEPHRICLGLLERPEDQNSSPMWEQFVIRLQLHPQNLQEGCSVIDSTTSDSVQTQSR